MLPSVGCVTVFVFVYGGGSVVFGPSPASRSMSSRDILPALCRGSGVEVSEQTRLVTDFSEVEHTGLYAGGGSVIGVSMLVVTYGLWYFFSK